MQIKYHLNGKEFDLTTEDMAINSTNFSVDKNGNMSCSSAEITDGDIILKNETDTGVKFKVITRDGATYTEIRPSGIRTVMGGKIIYWANGTNTAIRNRAGKTVLFTGNAIYIADDYNSDTYPIILNGSNGNISCVSLTQTSLEREKKNFEKLQSGIDIIKNIDIYKYNLKSEEDNTKKHIGFVIGDKYKYSKEITSTGNDGAELYSFVSVCCKAIQEQQTEIEMLKAKINKLEKGEK